MNRSNIRVFTEKSLFAVNNVSPDRTDSQNNIKVLYLVFHGRKKLAANSTKMVLTNHYKRVILDDVDLNKALRCSLVF